MRTFDAKYHGTCSDCGDHINPGDTIGFDADDGIACITCLRDEHRTTQRPVRVCPECNLDHAGKCDEW